MTDDELAERRAACERYVEAGRRLVHLDQQQLLGKVAADDNLFAAERARLYDEHREASVACDVLAGLSTRHAELRWRELWAASSGTTAVELNADDRAELVGLDRLEAEKIENLQRELEASVARLEQLRRLNERQGDEMIAPEAAEATTETNASEAGGEAPDPSDEKGDA